MALLSIRLTIGVSLLTVSAGLASCGDDASEPTRAEPPTSGPDANASTPIDGSEPSPSDAAEAPDAAVVDSGPKQSIGCTSGNGLPEGLTTFQLEGVARKYVVRLPTGYSKAKAWPVVYALHGNGGSVAEWDTTTGIKNIRAELKSTAIVVVTEAIAGQWRDYGADAATWPAALEKELRYFDELQKRLTTALCVREDAVFAMGFSGGGSFSGVLGCRRAYIRAIAAGGAVEYYDPKTCVSTPAAWITISSGDLAPARTAFRDFFRTRAKCAATTKPTAPNPYCVAYDGCDPTTPVHYCTFDGGHEWPSFGTAAMGDFFAPFTQ